LYIFLSYIITLLLYNLSRHFFLHSVFKVCSVSSMSEKKVFSTRVDDDLIKKLKHLAVDEDESLGNLLEEAIEDLLKKYEKQEKKAKK
jgi:hypothetical protein